MLILEVSALASPVFSQSPHGGFHALQCLPILRNCVPTRDLVKR